MEHTVKVRSSERVGKEQEKLARRNESRERNHPGAWRIAKALRHARGDAVVTDAVWSDAFYLATQVTSPSR